MYVWHLVDVMRIGTERLLTLTYDPGRGITCWDENALAEVRRYQQLSPVVGLIVLRSAAQAWSTATAVALADVRVRRRRTRRWPGCASKPRQLVLQLDHGVCGDRAAGPRSTAANPSAVRESCHP